MASFTISASENNINVEDTVTFSCVLNYTFTSVSLYINDNIIDTQISGIDNSVTFEYTFMTSGSFSVYASYEKKEDTYFTNTITIIVNDTRTHFWIDTSQDIAYAENYENYFLGIKCPSSFGVDDIYLFNLNAHNDSFVFNNITEYPYSGANFYIIHMSPTVQKWLTEQGINSFDYASVPYTFDFFCCHNPTSYYDIVGELIPENNYELYIKKTGTLHIKQNIQRPHFWFEEINNLPFVFGENLNPNMQYFVMEKRTNQQEMKVYSPIVEDNNTHKSTYSYNNNSSSVWYIMEANEYIDEGTSLSEILEDYPNIQYQISNLFLYPNGEGYIGKDTKQAKFIDIGQKRVKQIKRVSDGEILYKIPTYIESSDLTKYYKGPEKFIVNVYDNGELVTDATKTYNCPINNFTSSNKTVMFLLDGHCYTREYDERINGSGININFSAGEWPIETYYKDNNGIMHHTTNLITILSTINLIDGDAVSLNVGDMYTVEVLDTNGEISPNTGVYFNTEGIPVTVTSDSNGIAEFEIPNIPDGTHILTIQNNLSTEMTAVEITTSGYIDPTEPTQLSVTGTKSNLSKSHSDSSTLTATVLNGFNDPLSNQTVTFKKGSTILDTQTTDNNGQCTYTYDSVGAGDITITANCSSLEETHNLSDYLFVPPLDGTDAITKWTTLTNSTGDGVFQSHGSYLSNGWDNSGLWQLDFDVRTSNWKYVGLMPFCDSAINPFTDTKNNTYSVACWEGFTCPGGMGFSNISAPSSYSKKTATNTTYHMTIKKTASNRVEFILENNSAYTWVKESSLLANYSTLYFGSRDNPASRNSGGILQFSNIIVKPL